MTIGSEGQVISPATTNYTDGMDQPPTQGRQGEFAVAEIHGKWYTAALRKNSYWAFVTGVTIPVIVSNMVSVFSLWNPPSSGMHAELIDTELGQVAATTVVDSVAWYFSSGSQALAGTFTTKGVANTDYGAARIGDTPANTILPYKAYTHSGTPVRCDTIASFGAVTDNPGIANSSKQYDGRMIVPPGTVISVAMSTAAGFTSGLDISARWAEWPFA